MTRPTHVDKAAVVANLRARELHARADWVDRDLPAIIDTARNAALLRTLGIDVMTLPAPAGAVQPSTAAAQ